MKFKVISSNIRFDAPEDGEHVWANRRPILCKVINEYETDLLGTQEGRRPQLVDLDSDLVGLDMVDSHRNWIKERMYPTIFVNPKTIEVLESGDIWLSETPEIPESSSFDSAFPRLCTWIKGKFKKNNQKFFYVNCHLDHVKAETRIGQIKVLMEEVKKANFHHLPLLLSGDFNEGPQEAVRCLLISECPNIYDPWNELGYMEQESHHKFKGHLAGAQRIDWILADHLFKCESMILDKYSKSGIYPSDHFPLKAEFVYKG